MIVVVVFVVVVFVAVAVIVVYDNVVVVVVVVVVVIGMNLNRSAYKVPDNSPEELEVLRRAFGYSYRKRELLAKFVPKQVSEAER